MSIQTQGSWVKSANVPNCDFPIENLPFGTFSLNNDPSEFKHIGVAIGDEILDLHLLPQLITVPSDYQNALRLLSQGNLNAFMGLSNSEQSQCRNYIIELLRVGSPHEKTVSQCLINQSAVKMHLPCLIRDYTDFYASIHHATAVGKMFRADQPLLPNYQWVPIGYHGRASSITPSGSFIKRPVGQTRGSEGQPPIFQACRRLDYELEMGIFIGKGNELGTPIPIEEANTHFFGLCILNDWSARDIQAWEYQPLGPFLAKNFATSISPWIVTREALTPFQTKWTRNSNEPQPLPYLESQDNRAGGSYNIKLETWLLTKAMKDANLDAFKLMTSNFSEAAYWTIRQLITHHTSNGCNLSSGDLLGTGTLSGPKPEEAGSLLELSNGGKNPIKLPNGEERSFLEDGDTLILKAFCETENAVRIGFGECRGTISPANPIN